jgi:hypothetical protein
MKTIARLEVLPDLDDASRAAIERHRRAVADQLRATAKAASALPYAARLHEALALDLEHKGWSAATSLIEPLRPSPRFSKLSPGRGCEKLAERLPDLLGRGVGMRTVDVELTLTDCRFTSVDRAWKETVTYQEQIPRMKRVEQPVRSCVRVAQQSEAATYCSGVFHQSGWTQSNNPNCDRRIPSTTAARTASRWSRWSTTPSPSIGRPSATS